VLGAQIAVPVDHQPAPPSLEQLRAPGGQRRLHAAAQLPQPTVAHLPRCAIAPEIVQRRAHGGPQRRERTRGVVWTWLGGVKAGQQRPHRPQLRRRGRADPQALGERVALVIAAHVDGHLDGAGRLVVGVDEQLAPAGDHGDRAAVERGRQTAVDAHLLAAHGAASLEGPVVEKGQDDGLLDLQGAIAGHEDPRTVRLMTLDRPAILVARDDVCDRGCDRVLHASILGRPRRDLRRQNRDLAAGECGRPRRRATYAKPSTARISRRCAPCRLGQSNRPQERNWS
jgi:hypothetical protein